MPRWTKWAIITAVIIFGWFGIWYTIMAPHVARVKASIEHHYQAFRAAHRDVSLRADAVYATGFPLRFEVGVDRPTLSMIEGEESYSISFARVTLTPIDSKQGTYRVNLPHEVEAIYAKSGATPEHYFVAADITPQVQLSAKDAQKRCGFGTDQACPPVANDAPIISYAVGVPKTITLTMTLNGESRTEPFQLAPIDVNIPIFQPIPTDVSWPVELFVRVLREALVFKTPSETPQ